jgi:hypothetical protein
MRSVISIATENQDAAKMPPSTIIVSNAMCSDRRRLIECPALMRTLRAARSGG